MLSRSLSMVDNPPKAQRARNRSGKRTGKRLKTVDSGECSSRVLNRYTVRRATEEVIFQVTGQRSETLAISREHHTKLR